MQFKQFPVLDFGLDHYVSEPFNCHGSIVAKVVSFAHPDELQSLLEILHPGAEWLQGRVGCLGPQLRDLGMGRTVGHQWEHSEPIASSLM